MKKIIILIMAVGLAVSGGLYIQQTKKLNQAQANADELQNQVTDLQSRLDEQERANSRLRNEIAKSVDTQRSKVVPASAGTKAQAQSATTNPGKGQAKTENPLADMLKNPNTKEMLRNQQKTILGPMIDKNYAKLFADLKLTPEQSSALKDIILNKQLEAAGMSVAMMSGDMDAAKRAELTQQIKEANESSDAQIKELLGDSNYAQFQSYEKTMAERMAVNGFKDQLGNGSIPLSDDQEQKLINVMTQEKQNFKFTTDFSDNSKFDGDFGTMFTEDKINTYIQETEKLNQQYVSGAQNVLTPDQMTVFKKYLEAQQAMQSAGMKFAAKMFSSDKPAQK